ncbi:MAG: AAA family ATPase [Proteobacteria bacterium]|nr:AAA family ATPase [Pseudomonadota bacterium]
MIVSGTPGTGKTTLSKKLASKLKFYYIDVNRIIKKRGISEGYDKKRKTKIIDVKILNKALIKEIKKYDKIKSIKNKKHGLIIDSHLSHYLPKKYVDMCIITKCDLKILEKRLKKKKFSKNKIRENLDAEIFDICLHEAKENKHKIIIIDTTKDINIKKIIKKIDRL